MSVVSIRRVLETALNSMSPALSTSFENAAFTPPVQTTAYQQVNIMFARPDNTEYGNRHRELGIMQVKLMYSLQAGTSAIGTRAELIRTTFYRGATFSNGGITVIVSDTPEIVPGSVESDRFAQVVKVRFFANV